MRELIALAEGIGPGIHEAENALHSVGRREHERDEADREHADQRHEMPPAHTAEKEHAERGDRDHDEGAEVRLVQKEPCHHQHDAEHRQEPALEIF